MHESLSSKDIKQTNKVIRINLTNNPYPIYIESNSLNKIGTIYQELNLGKKVIIITNSQINKLYGPPLEKSFKNLEIWLKTIEIPNGESYKSLETVTRLLDKILDYRLERKDTIIALGGGIIGDIAGFMASIYLRGINLIQCPTSLLAQVDAAIGGKTGVNHPKGKNLIGSFYQPKFVLIDPNTLKTLPKREILCGLAEIVKYGIALDKPLFWYLEQHKADIKKLKIEKNMDKWIYLIEKSCQNKAKIVMNDEKEANIREVLNFGHTIGHAIEAAYKYQEFLHGEAIAIGMKAATFIARKLNLIPNDIYQRIVNLLEELGFKLSIDKYNIKNIYEHLFSDKKIKDSKLRFILPIDIGKTIIRDDIPEKLIIETLEALGV